MNRKCNIGRMLKKKIRRYVFRYIDSNMYILVEGGEALVIDPHINLAADEYLRHYGVKKVTILLTHEHFDHVCGIPWFREHYCVNVVCQESALDEHAQRLNGRPISISLVLSDQGRDDEIIDLESEYPAFKISAETTFRDSLRLAWHGHDVYMKSAPGHSPASTIIFLDGCNAFVGDSIVPNFKPTLRWPGSNAKHYEEKVVPMLLSLPSDTIIYPGHGKPLNLSELTYEDSVWKIL